MAYRVGQTRYSGGSDYVNVLTPVIDTQYVTVSQSSDDDNNTSFRDIKITLNDGAEFEAGTDYYFFIAIPQDLSYNMTFNIKLMKNETMSQSYQFIKQIVVYKGGNTNYTHDVALYEKSDGTVAVMFPIVRDTANSIVTVKDALYYQETDSGTEFFLGTGTRDGYIATSNVNMIKMTEVWRESEEPIYAGFDMVFRPIEGGFSRIVLEMLRTTEDYSIQSQQTRSDGTQYIQYGRTLDPKKLAGHITLYSLNNLVDTIHKNGTLTRIGVWSHPNLVMAVNGEEIRVGPSGYYEDDVIKVSSLGIVAPPGDYSNMFTCDYTYDADEEITSTGGDGS